MRINKFDALVTVFLLASLFTVGLHIGKNKDVDTVEERAVLLLVTSAKCIGNDTEILIDGNIPASLTSYDGEYAILIIRGTELRAGFLLDGKKYIAENQPICSVSENGFLNGRIISIQKHFTSV